MNQQMESVITLDISNAMIRSDMKKQDVIDYLKKHPEIKIVKSKKNVNGFCEIRMSYMNKTFNEKISAGFHEEQMISLDRNTSEYHFFRKDPNV